MSQRRLRPPLCVRVLVVVVLCAASCHAVELFFQACTRDPDRIILCINPCEADQPPLRKDGKPDPNEFYLPRTVTFDAKKQSLSPVAESDIALICPNLDDELTVQQSPRLEGACLSDATVTWTLRLVAPPNPKAPPPPKGAPEPSAPQWNDTVPQPNLTLHLEVPRRPDVGIIGELSFQAFYIVTLRPFRVYFIYESLTAQYHSGYVFTDPFSAAPPVPFDVRLNETDASFDGRYAMAFVTIAPNSSCSIEMKPNPSYPIVYESIGLIAFPESPDRIWYTYSLDRGFRKFAKSGLLDTRLQALIEVHGLWVMRRLYASKNEWNASATYYNLTAEVAKFKLKAPTAVSPSVFLFALSLTLVAALIVAEVITRRRARAAEGEAYARLGAGAGARRRSFPEGGSSVLGDEDIELSVLHARRRRGADDDSDSHAAAAAALYRRATSTSTGSSKTPDVPRI